ncbi:hypothetical protein [Streptacidiphilus sp. PAMC 29251]
MERADILRDLTAKGADTAPQHLADLSERLGILTSDLLVVAGQPVPAELLPPERDARVLKELAYRASYCDHAQLAALESFVEALPRGGQDTSPPSAASRVPLARPDAGPFAAVLAGLLRNRGFGPRELPFLGLALSTIYGALTFDRPDEHRWFRLSRLAGPLGWRLPDLLAVADEPFSERPGVAIHCHHLGRIFMAAVPLATEQLIEAVRAADRLDVRQDQGVWRPVAPGFAEECPDTG